MYNSGSPLTIDTLGYILFYAISANRYVSMDTGSQVLGSMQLRQEVSHMEEERVQVVNNIDELEQKIKDLDNQMDESIREVRPLSPCVLGLLGLSNVKKKSWKRNTTATQNNCKLIQYENRTYLVFLYSCGYPTLCPVVVFH